MAEFRKVAATVFGVVALLHLWRAIAGLDLIIGGWTLAAWWSWIAFLFAGGLSYWGWKG